MIKRYCHCKSIAGEWIFQSRTPKQVLEKLPHVTGVYRTHKEAKEAAEESLKTKIKVLRENLKNIHTIL